MIYCTIQEKNNEEVNHNQYVNIIKIAKSHGKQIDNKQSTEICEGDVEHTDCFTCSCHHGIMGVIGCEVMGHETY